MDPRSAPIAHRDRARHPGNPDAALPRRGRPPLDVWDDEADAFGSNTVDVHLARLRSKLAGADVRIETVRDFWSCSQPGRSGC